MARSRRCCCCNDVYCWNDDSAFDWFRLSGTSTTPRLMYSDTTGYYDHKVDYVNKCIALVKVGPTVAGVGSVKMYVSVDLDLNNGAAFVGDMQGLLSGVTHRVTHQPGLAVDYLNEKLYYVTVDSIDANQNRTFQLRCVNYARGGDHQVCTDPPITYTPGIGGAARTIESVPELYTLTLDNFTQRLYYVRSYIQVDTPAALRRTKQFDLMTVKTDGTDHRVVCSLNDMLHLDHYTLDAPTLLGAFYDFDKGQLIVGLDDFSDENIAPLIRYKSLNAIDIPVGVVRRIAENSGPVGAGPVQLRVWMRPQVSIKDGNIYYYRGNVNIPAGTNAKAICGLGRINFDGTKDDLLMNFVSPTNEFNFSGPTGRFSLGCGFEDTGEKYEGPNG